MLSWNGNRGAILALLEKYDEYSMHNYDDPGLILAEVALEECGFVLDPWDPLICLVMIAIDEWDRRRLRPSDHWLLNDLRAHRDKVVCPLCGATSLEAGVSFDRDHITPKRDGGSDLDDNIQMICTACHRNKTAGENRRRMQETRLTSRVTADV